MSLNVLTKDLDAAMALMMDVLTKPRFQEDRFIKAKDDLIQGMKTRNDNTAGIEGREWNRLIYGDDLLPQPAPDPGFGRCDHGRSRPGASPPR